MFERFLTSVLQVIIVLDVIGAVAYFALGALKYRRRQAEAGLYLPAAPARRPGVRERLAASFPGFARMLPWRRPRLALAGSSDFDQLRRVLHSFREGLA